LLQYGKYAKLFKAFLACKKMGKCRLIKKTCRWWKFFGRFFKKKKQTTIYGIYGNNNKKCCTKGDLK
jgi:N-glycosylase/DNA lyase